MPDMVVDNHHGTTGSKCNINPFKLKPMKAEKITVSNYGGVRNQFIISTDKGTYFQSYYSIIAFRPYDRTKRTVLDRQYWDYSRTTGKYRNMFLGETIEETRRKIKEADYILADLN